MSKIIFLVVIVIGVILYFNRGILLPSKKGGKKLSGKEKFQITIGVLLAIMVVLAVTGRVHWISVVFTALIPVVRNLLPLLIKFFPLLQRYYHQRGASAGSGNAQSGKSSTVASEVLEMTLYHDTGEFEGVVLKGNYSGHKLSSLEESDLMSLWHFCRSEDQESADLLAAYLERRFGQDWINSHLRGGQREEQSRAQSSGEMSIDEAYSLLGLTEGASKEDIVSAHRKLMQKVHPDRGGNDYLASKINLAKDVLLKK